MSNLLKILQDKDYLYNRRISHENYNKLGRHEMNLSRHLSFFILIILNAGGNKTH